MTAEISRLPARHETPLQRARRLHAESQAIAHECAEMVMRGIAELSERCLEVADLEPLKSGQRDAFKKLSMEMESRLLSMKQIAGARP